MARLSQDDSSWRAHGLKKRYADFDPDKTPKAKAKKNTKKWCRGIEGREHEIRDVVIGLSGHYHRDACTQNPDYTGTECKHYRTITKCVNCDARVGWGWRRDKRATKTNKDPEQRALAEKWCTEGHLWDWTTFEDDDGRYVVVKGKIMRKTKNHKGEAVFITPYRIPRVHKVCLMCNLERRSQSREITPEDL